MQFGLVLLLESSFADNLSGLVTFVLRLVELVLGDFTGVSDEGCDSGPVWIVALRNGLNDQPRKVDAVLFEYGDYVDRRVGYHDGRTGGRTPITAHRR